jgi:outer membrane protein assembly factor BamB
MLSRDLRPVLTALSLAVLGLAGCKKEKEDATPRPEPAPAPAPVSVVEVAWHHEGTGGVYSLLPLRNDHGQDDLIVGGRRLARMTPEGLFDGVPAWIRSWPDDPRTRLGLENRFPTMPLLAVDATGDGADEIMAFEGHNIYLYSATGGLLWETRLQTMYVPFSHALLSRTDGPPDLVTAGGDSLLVISTQTGEVRWIEDSFAQPTSRVAVARIDPGGEERIVVITETEDEYGHGGSRAGGALSLVPAVFAYSASGERLFEFIPEGKAVSLATGDLSGDGVDEIVVGTSNGMLHAINGDGSARWSVEVGPEPLTRLVATDVTGDGRAEIFGAYDVDPPSIIAWDSEGNQLWRRQLPLALPGDTLRLHQREGDERPTLVVLLGRLAYDPDGYAMALDPLTGTELWHKRAESPVHDSVLLRVDGKELLAFGGYDSRVWLVDLATGQEHGGFPAGAFTWLMAAGDFGNGETGVVYTDDARNLFVRSGRDGSLRWSKMLTTSWVADAAVGQLGGRPVVVLGGFEASSSGLLPRLWIHAPDGALLQQLALQSLPAQVQLFDVDGDGDNELILAVFEPRAGWSCGALILDASGTELASAQLPPCDWPTVHIERRGDGYLVGFLGEQDATEHPSYVAMLGTGLARRWIREVDQAVTWMHLIDDDLIIAGMTLVGGDPHGRASRLSGEDGRELWVYWNESSWEDESHRGGDFYSGALIPGLGVGGGEAVALSSGTGQLHVVDGRTSEELWVLKLETPTPYSNLVSGPLAYVPPTDSLEGWIAATQTTYITRTAGQILAIDLAGNIIASHQTPGDPTAMQTFSSADGRRGVAVTAGLNVYVLEAGSAQGP